MKNYWLTIFAIFAVPLGTMIPLKGTDVWYVQYLVLLSILFLSISLALWKYNWTISLFTIACWFSAFVVTNQSPKAIFCLIQIYLSCLAMMAISKFSEVQKRTILKCIAYVIILQGFWCTLQYLGIDPVFDHPDDPLRDSVVGLSGSYNQIGLFFALTAPTAVAYFWPLLAITIFGIWQSYTTTTMIAAIIGVLFYCRFMKRKIFLALLAILVLFGALYISKIDMSSSQKIKDRYNVATKSVQAIFNGEIELEGTLSRHPHSGRAYIRNGENIRTARCNRWFGFGLGNFPKISIYTQKFLKMDRYYSHAHNDYVEAFFELGITGGIIILLWLIDLFQRFIFGKKTFLLVLSFSCILVHLISALGIFTVHTALSGMLLIIFLAIFYGETNG